MNDCSSFSSWSEMTALSFHCFGRVIGVTLLLDQTPCRSGCPSADRGTLYEGSAPYIAPGGSFPDCAVSVAVARPTAARRAVNVFMDIHHPNADKCWANCSNHYLL